MNCSTIEITSGKDNDTRFELDLNELFTEFQYKEPISRDDILFIKIETNNGTCNEEDCTRNAINFNKIKSENIVAIHYPYISMDILRKIHNINATVNIDVDKWIGVIVLQPLCDFHTEKRQSDYIYDDDNQRTFITEIAECDSYPCDTIEDLYYEIISSNTKIMNNDFFIKIQTIVAQCQPNI